MKSFRPLLLLCILLISITSYSQFTISGMVVDSASREPLYGASVFCQNTTSGTATNKQGEFSMSLKPGGYDLIISFTGYQTKEMRISESENKPMTIELVKEEKSMSEVIVRSSNEVLDGWEKYGKFFIDNFIGTSPNAAQCTLLNHQVLRFFYYKKSDRLKVLASEPIMVENRALGYNLRYQLDSFLYYHKTRISSYRGYCLFSELEGSFDDMKKWSTNRKSAYNGSKLHFMRAYYDSAVQEEDFEIALLDEENNTKFNVIENPYDSLFYTGYDDSTHEAEFYYPRKISVTYKRRPEPEYIKQYKLPKNVPARTSYIELLDAIAIKENGFFYYQKDWVNQGYWSWKNLADLLPYDYIP